MLNFELDASGRVFVGIKVSSGIGVGQFISSSGIVQGPLAYRSTGMDTMAMDSSGNLVPGGTHPATCTTKTWSTRQQRPWAAECLECGLLDDSRRITVLGIWYRSGTAESDPRQAVRSN